MRGGGLFNVFVFVAIYDLLHDLEAIFYLP